MDVMQETAVLSIRGLTKALGGRRILTDICLDLYPGEILGFLGPNGSGKTTTIKLMLGLLRVEAGEILIGGHNITTDFEAAIEQVGGIIENPEMYKNLTGRQNLMQYLRMYDGRVPVSRIDEVVSLVGLSDRIDEKISRYSLGMRQRLGLAQALLNHPRLLVLDEPTNGLDPAGIHDLRDILKRLAHEEGTAVFVSSHLLSEMDLMCDRVCVIDHGKVIGTHSLEDLRRCATSGDVDLFRITTDSPDALRAVAAQQGIAVQDTERQDVVQVTVPKGTISAFLKALALSDVAYTEASPVRRSLEDAFLEMTRGISAQTSVQDTTASSDETKGGDAL